MKTYVDDSLMLHTDLYQINMAETYWRDGMHDRNSVFDIYFRKLPFGNGYGVFAGLERVISLIEQFGFTESDIDYLREAGYQEDYLDIHRYDPVNA
jgi:nicotinate phosphoribosyltransferase